MNGPAITIEEAHQFKEEAMESLKALKKIDEAAISELQEYLAIAKEQAGTELTKTIESIETAISDLNTAILTYNQNIETLKNTNPVYFIKIVGTTTLPYNEAEDNYTG